MSSIFILRALVLIFLILILILFLLLFILKEQLILLMRGMPRIDFLLLF